MHNNSESTGFQPIIDHMNFHENIKERMSIWPRKLTSVMEIHRQRFSQNQKKFKPKPVVVNHSQSPPFILPQTSRSQPRLKQKTQTPPPPLISHNQEYITLANLSKVLRVLQTHEKTNNNNNNNSDMVTDVSTSTNASVKQRVQQHLQETAIRWWRPIRSSDSHPVSPTTHSSETSTAVQQYTDENIQLQRNLPLLTIVSNSTQQMNISSKYRNKNSKYNESDISTDIPPATSFVLPTKILKRQEPLIMQPRGMHIHSYDHRYNNNNNMNFFQQQRLVRQS